MDPGNIPETGGELAEFLEDDEDGLDVEVGAAADDAPTEPGGEEEAPAPAQAEGEEKPAEPAPAQDGAEPEPAAATQEEAAPTEPEPASEGPDTQRVEALRAEAEELLAKQHYVLDQETTDRLEIEPQEVIPRLMARVYMDAVGQTMQRVTEAFPHLLDAAMRERERRSGLEEKFFQAWPQLDREKHAADIRRFGEIYRQVNPKATADEFIRDVGAQVLVAHRIPLTAETETEPAPAQAYRPAAASAPSREPTSNPNPFEELDKLFEQDLTEY